MSGPATVCQGSSNTYSVAAVTGATSYTWTLPTGWTGSSTTNSITTTASANSGQICVTANNACGSSTQRCLSVTVNTVPSQPGSISGAATVCQNSNNTYSVATVSGATSYTWTLPTGWTGSSTTNSITATASANSGQICVTANNACGSSTQRCMSVTVTPVPSQPGSISGPATVCQNSSNTYSIATVSGATSYTWTLPTGWTGSSTTNPITETASANGGQICVTANNSCGSSAQRCLSVTVNTIPSQPGPISGPTNPARPSTGNVYSVANVTGITYNWTYGGSGATITSGQGTNIITVSYSSSATSGTWAVTPSNTCGNGPQRTLDITFGTTQQVIMTIPDDIVGDPGENDVHVPILMDNQTSYNGPIASMQLVISYDATIGIHLPNNTSYALSSRTSGFSVSMSVAENGANSSVTILLFNTSGGTIAPGTGSILDMLFDVDVNATIGGISDICFTQCLISDQNANSIPADYSDCGIFEIPACEPCDVNCDGLVNIFDLQKVINVIIGIETDPMIIERSDVNNDGSVNIFDLQLVINCIIGNDGGQSGPDSRGNNILTLPTLNNIIPGSTGNFGLNLANADVVSSGQIEFTYNSTIGFDISGVTATGRLTNYSPPVFNKNTTNPAAVKVTVLFFSMSGGTISPGNGDILTYQYTTTSGATESTAFTFNQALLSDPSANPLNVTTNNGSVSFAPGTCDPGWEFVQTISSHTIAIPLSVNPTLFGEPLEPGDFIGVFYLDNNGNESCGGYEVWTGTENLALTAYGDDNTTPVKEGFAANEEILWKVYDCGSETAYEAFVTYDPTMPNYNGLFASWGLSRLLSLVCMQCQTLSIPSGWSGVSLYVTPSDPSVENIFAPIVNDLVLTRNINKIYWPSQSINTIGNWDNQSGYAIKLLAAHDLEICGTPVTPRVITLNPGWHYLPVLSECPANTMDLFGSVLDDIVIVQEIAGSKVFWPAFQIYSLNELQPGKGYAIKVLNQVTLTYPACTKANQWENTSTINHFISPWNEFDATAQPHFISIDASLLSILSEGDVIGVVAENGKAYGSLVINSVLDNHALVIYGDDPTTLEKDGFSENEMLEFRLWKAETNKESILDVSFNQSMPNPEMAFRNNGISSIARIANLATGINQLGSNLNVQIIPNPVKDEFVVTLNSEKFNEGTIIIYTIDGQKLRTQSISQNKTNFNISDLSPGIYILNIVIDGNVFNKRLVKQ